LSPYCKIIGEHGPVEDSYNYGTVIMLQNGVSFESFPKKVEKEAKEIQQYFKKWLEDEKKFW